MRTVDSAAIEWLMTWFRSRCNGDWERQHGIRIRTLDNPGWALDVDVVETAQAGKILSQKMAERSEDDWLFVEIKEDRFCARGGPGNLTEMLRFFTAYSSHEGSGEDQHSAGQAGGTAMTADETVMARLQRWYHSQCDGDWEHSYGVKIETLDNPGWLVTVDLRDTAWELLSQPRRIVQRSDTDWVQTEVLEGKFIGCGGVGNLEEVLKLFLDALSGAPRPRTV